MKRSRAGQILLDLKPVLDYDATQAATENGVYAAEFLTSDDRKMQMLDAIQHVARTHRFFTADQVWDDLGEVGDDFDDGSGLGPVMRMAAADRIIEKTGTTRPSERAATHGRPMRLWRSLIFTEEL